jgi:hypothetical protein
VKSLSILALFIALCPAIISAQQPARAGDDAPPTSIGIVLSTNDEETVWNVMRLANFSLNSNDTVTVFLIGKGVELEQLALASERVREQVDGFRDRHGTILACGTCLQSRNLAAPQRCAISTMSELYGLIRHNAIVLTF